MIDLKMLHDGFINSVKNYSLKEAVIYKDEVWTYKELNQYVCGIKKIIRNRKSRSKLIGILGEKSNLTIAIILAILESHYAYLPLDINYPEERIKYIIENSGIDCILITNPQYKDFIKNEIEVINISYNDKDVSCEEVDNQNNCDGLAYVIYTSGSTGRPNGVQIYHSNIINTLNWRIKYYGMDQNTTVFQFASLSFDSSVEDIFCALSCGGTLIIPEDKKRLNLKYVENMLFSYKVTQLMLVPSVYELFLQRIKKLPKSMKEVILAGENISKELLKKHFEANESVRLFNEYGPTENSVCSTVAELKKDDEINIGKPIDGVEIAILNDHLQDVNKGEKGVLYLCGKGIAHGYINNFAATKEKFFKLRDRDMYCTGDIVYMDEQSNLVYVGRSDNEIKVNGIRVNLEEITSLILHEFQFLNCITLLLSYNKIRKICMVISKSNENLLPLILTYIKRNVPQYMRPNYIYVTNNIYKLPNGKNDNKKMEKEILDIMLPDSEVKSAILIKIHEILSTYSLDKVEDDEDLLDAGIDSISLVNFLVEIEDCYNIEIDIMDKEIDGNFTILYIYELVVKEKYGYLAKV